MPSHAHRHAGLHATHLVDDVLLVHVLEDVGADGGVQVGLHELKDEVDVLVVLGLEQVLEADDVLVVAHLLQKDHLAERPLRVRRVLERVEDLFQRDDRLCLPVDCLPHHTICHTHVTAVTNPSPM